MSPICVPNSTRRCVEKHCARQDGKPGVSGEAMKRFTIRSIRRTLSWINGVEAHVDEPMADSAGPPLVSLHASGWIASAFDPISEIFLACRGRNIVTAKLVPRPDVEK